MPIPMQGCNTLWATVFPSSLTQTVTVALAVFEPDRPLYVTVAKFVSVPTRTPLALNLTVVCVLRLANVHLMEFVTIWHALAGFIVSTGLARPVGSVSTITTFATAADPDGVSVRVNVKTPPLPLRCGVAVFCMSRLPTGDAVTCIVQTVSQSDC